MRYRLFLVSLVWLFSVLLVAALDRFQLDPELAADAFRQRVSTPAEPDERIMLVGIDDDTFAADAFNRPNHALVLDNLRAAGARLVFFDIVFDEDRGPELDTPLLDAILAWPRPVVLAGSSATVEEEGQQNGETVMLEGVLAPPKLAPALVPTLEAGKAVIGSIEKSEDNDGVLRSYFLAADFGRGDGPVPSAALACFALLNSVPPKLIDYTDRSVEVPPSIPVNLFSRNDGGGHPITTYLYGMRFHPPATGPQHRPGEGTYQVVSYMQLLEPTEALRTRLKDAIVVIGENTSSAENDVVKTPVGRMKGFEVHAQCLDRLLHHEFTVDVPEATNDAITMAVIGAVAILGIITWPLPVLIFLGTMIVGAYTAFNLWLYDTRYLVVDLAGPVTGALIALALHILVRLMITSRFLGRFIPKEAARGILNARITAEATEATVIVTDIRGYTSLSETRTPVEMLKLLNEYHSVTVDIYHRYGGNVLTFQGDAQLVVFGYPRKLKDAAGDAVRACVEVMAAIDELRVKWGIAERKNFDVGAGLTTGLVYVGDIGSRDQANYTVIGEVVRTSHKVQSMSDALEGNVLMDESSYEACVVKPRTTAIPGVMLEGFPEPKTLYRVEPDIAAPQPF